MSRIHVAIVTASAVHYLRRRFTLAAQKIRGKGELMTRSLQEISPVVALPQPDGGRVEISVVDDMIWISDYSSAGTCNFTLRVLRGRLEGAENARVAVHDLFKERARGKSSAAYGRNSPYRAALNKIAEAMVAAPPTKAGYWFIDPTFSPHGGPVVVLDP